MHLQDGGVLGHHQESETGGPQKKQSKNIFTEAPSQNHQE